MLSILNSMVRVSGSNIIYLPNFTGIGGAQVILSGQTVLISGGAGGGAGVSSIDGLVGSVIVTGTGNCTTFVLGGQLYISGNSNDGINLSGALQSTGSYLYGLVTGLSGQAVATYATIANLAATGSNLYNLLVNLSGAQNTTIAQTGSILYTLITNLSGASNSTFVPTGSILSFLTGVPTGVDNFFVWFSGYTFPTVPRVVVTWETSFFPVIYGVSVSGRTTSGFYALLTDTVIETGCYLDVIAKS